MSRAKSVKSERLTLAEAISSLVAKEEAFLKSVEDLKKFKADALSKLDLEIETKKTELQTLADEFKKTQKDKEIKIAQFLAEFQRKGAIEILEESQEVPIKAETLTKLKEKLETLQQDQTKELEKIKAEERASAKIALNAAIKTCELQHKAETAQLKAITEQQQKEIKTLEKTIESMKTEIAAQRQLTKEVAEAGKQGNIHQSFGKQ